jgi:hypothetical protein
MTRILLLALWLASPARADGWQCDGIVTSNGGQLHRLGAQHSAAASRLLPA